MFGVLLCLLHIKLSLKEQLLCMLAYMPKATVQAAIGDGPLAMGLDLGNIVLTIAVMAKILNTLKLFEILSALLLWKFMENDRIRYVSLRRE